MHIAKKYGIVYGITVLIAVLMIFVVSLIPQGLIKENAHDGRERFISGDAPNFRLLDGKDYSTYIDARTDDLMMDLTYNLGEKDSNILNPLVYKNHQLDSFTYGRYWHGYSVLIRPLLLFTNQDGITTILGGITVLGLLLLLCCLLYHKHYAMALAVAAASYIAYFDVTVQCLEYIPCMMLSVYGSLYVIFRSVYKKFTGAHRYLFYFVMGLMVVYFDFLTFETLSLTLPLLIDICMNAEIKLKNTIISCCNWVAGYVLMFIAKFVLYLLAGGNFMALCNRIIMRTAGGSGSTYTIKESLSSNLSFLRFENATTVFIGLLITALLTTFIMGKEYSRNYHWMLIVFIPLVRYCALCGHSVNHGMFTYHALMGSMVAIIMIIVSPILYFAKIGEKKWEP